MENRKPVPDRNENADHQKDRRHEHGSGQRKHEVRQAPGHAIIKALIAGALLYSVLSDICSAPMLTASGSIQNLRDIFRICSNPAVFEPDMTDFVLIIQHGHGMCNDFQVKNCMSTRSAAFPRGAYVYEKRYRPAMPIPFSLCSSGARRSHLERHSVIAARKPSPSTSAQASARHFLRLVVPDVQRSASRCLRGKWRAVRVSAERLTRDHFPEASEEMPVGHFQHSGQNAAPDAAGDHHAAQGAAY